VVRHAQDPEHEYKRYRRIYSKDIRSGQTPVDRSSNNTKRLFIPPHICSLTVPPLWQARADRERPPKHSPRTVVIPRPAESSASEVDPGAVSPAAWVDRTANPAAWGDRFSADARAHPLCDSCGLPGWLGVVSLLPPPSRLRPGRDSSPGSHTFSLRW